MEEQYFHIIGRPGCPYCDKALSLLKDKDLPHTSESHDRGSEPLNEAMKRYNWKTVPIINHVKVDKDGTIHNRFVGGFSDLVAYLGET